MNNTMERLQEIFRDVFDDEELVITEDTTSNDLEDWDSLTHMQLIVEIEQEFGIRFSTAEVKVAENVGEFVEIIKSKLG